MGSIRPLVRHVIGDIDPRQRLREQEREQEQRAVAAMKPGDFLCLENTRFHPGEEKNDPAFVAALAKLGDIFVNDAFSVSHRAHASTEGLAHVLPAYAGRTLQAEVEAFEKVLDAPARPLAAIVGGAKISTKLDVLGKRPSSQRRK